MKSAPTALSQAAQLLLEVFASSGLTLGPESWTAALRSYALEVQSTLPAHSLGPVAEELERHHLLERVGSQLVATPSGVEQGLLRLRKEQRGPAVSKVIYETVFPLLHNAFEKSDINFRLSVLLGTSRYFNPYYWELENSQVAKPKQFYQMARGWKLAESFQQVEARWRMPLVELSLEWAGEHLEDAPGAVAFLETQASASNILLLHLGQYLLLRNQTEPLKKLLQARVRVPSLLGVVAFLSGHQEEARQYFDQASIQEESAVLSLALARACRVLSLLISENLPQAERSCSTLGQGPDPWLLWLCDQRMGKSRHPQPDVHQREFTFSEWLAASAAALALEDGKLKAELEGAGRKLMQKAQDCGFSWAATQIETILNRLTGGTAKCPPWDSLKPESPWKRRLGQLLTLARQPEAQAEERIIWCVNPCPNGQGWEVTGRLQTSAKKGGWTKGKAIDLLKPPPRCADDADLNVFRLVMTRDHTHNKMLQALVGHPRVYHGDADQLLEVVQLQPEFRVQQVPGGLEVRIDPPCLNPSGVVVQLDGASILQIYKFDPLLQKFSEILGQGLLVPESEKQSIQVLLDHLPSRVTIASDLATHAAEEVQADSSLVLRVRPLKEGLEMTLLVRPLGPDGPECSPARGGRRLLSTRHGRRLQAVRNLEQERANWDQLLSLCPTLEQSADEPYWALPDLRTSLEALEELTQLPPELLTVEWPEGQSLRVRQRVSAENLELAVQAKGEWFQLEGELKLSETQKWELQELLDQMRNATGRFIALGSGEFLALTEDFRRRLQELENVSEPAKGKALRIHPLATPVLRGLPVVSGDQAFEHYLLRMEQSETLKSPLPPTFQADLRSYQLEGFQWLTQRAHWGVGACLADDMGLGKTLQALAMLVQRAPQGPALVVAPTSVCGNWLEEARRFAPTLSLQWLAEGDRRSAVEQAGAFDVVVVSYGVLARETELLSSRVWTTLVLDEAQAIKNHATQRFQNVLKLNSEFRVVTTGTPVENRLEELWALFRFLNAGLLGPLESFRRRFIAPIEAGDNKARTHLRRLVHPFLLRRTKTQVLNELPPRTDIRLEVELTAGERAYYEALRVRALEKLDNEEVEAMAVLAELTKLRRACCHPCLVEKKKKSTPGSKLEALRELLDDMRQGGHRALIFSQFVDHLSLVEELLKQEQIAYQYLDGSTPAAERLRRVQDFQAGVGEVFLISLRAGGFGLNLTAADYVVHMDPWWNPAVEDQASDRAHRFGQQRPVTVYRLVARDTVEEKILALHQQKRELADGLLEGAEVGMRLSASELLALMKE